MYYELLVTTSLAASESVVVSISQENTRAIQKDVVATCIMTSRSNMQTDCEEVYYREAYTWHNASLATNVKFTARKKTSSR